MINRGKILKGLECCAETISKACPMECPFWDECMAKDDGSNMYSVMQAALELLKEQGWNVLTEDTEGVIHGLPGDDGRYIMTDGKDIWIDDYVDGVADGIILDSGRDIREITAWMYTPELPEQSGD